MLHRADNQLSGRTRSYLQVAVLSALLAGNGMVGTRSVASGWLHLLFPTAHAEGGGCQSCQGGGQGEEGGGGGGQAGEILLGIAAIIAPIAAAMAQVSAAKTQAEADKFIAKTAADASITQTKIQASVTEQLSDNQRALSEKNLEVTQQLAREQEAARQERVNLQLSALQQERQAQESERREIRAIEQDRIDQQIAFAKQQADENLKLARLSINSQLVTQGLAPVGGSAGARGRLSTTTDGSSTTSTSFGSSITQRAIASVDTPSTAITGGSGTVARAAVSFAGVSATSSLSKPQASVPSAVASTKLIRAVSKSKPATSGGTSGLVAGRAASARGAASGFRFNGTRDPLVRGVSPQLDQQMKIAGVVRGSTRGMRQLTEEAKQGSESKTDLGSFLSTVQGGQAPIWRGNRNNGGNATTGFGSVHGNRGLRR